MLSLSQTTGYAILALGCLRQCDCILVQAKEIAQCTGISHPYLLKILNSMVRAGLVSAKRGYRGGFALAKPAKEISLMDISEAVDGKACLPKCLLGWDGCSDAQYCPTHDFWEIERARIEAKLRSTSLKDIADFDAKRTRRRIKICNGSSKRTAHLKDNSSRKESKSCC